MDLTFSVWLVILLAALAANLPFANERLLAAIPLRRAVKPFWMRLVELAVLYAAVLAVGFFLEGRMGNVFPQRWEFYVITICLFLVLAFPGFVFRYLRRRHA